MIGNNKLAGNCTNISWNSGRASGQEVYISLRKRRCHRGSLSVQGATTKAQVRVR